MSQLQTGSARFSSKGFHFGLRDRYESISGTEAATWQKYFKYFISPRNENSCKRPLRVKK